MDKGKKKETLEVFEGLNFKKMDDFIITLWSSKE
jgi:hypothetical protein